MSAGFVDFSAKADVTPAILKQQLEDATDQDKSINAAENELLERTKAGSVSSVDILNVSIPLVLSKSSSYIERGVFKLVELLRDTIEIEKEVGFCALFHLALGHYKLSDERTALGEVQSLLASKSFHTSALALKQLCIDKMISKQKSSGLFSRFLRKKEESQSQQLLTTSLSFLTAEERENAIRTQDEADRAVLATMFPSSVPGQDIDIEAMKKALASNDSLRSRPSTIDPSENSSYVDSIHSESGSTAPPPASGSYQQLSFSRPDTMNGRDSFMSDATGNPDVRASMPVDLHHSSSSFSVSSSPASSVLTSTMPPSRSSLWVRSKPGKEPAADPGFQAPVRAHDSLPTSLVRRSRPLRASQSARSAPSAEYLAKITSSSAPVPHVGDNEEDGEEEEDEEFELEPFVPEPAPTFEFEPYSADPRIAQVEAVYANLAETHAAQEAEMAQLIKDDIARCKLEYQELLQTHQTAQYDLLKLQQDEVTQLQHDQLAALEEQRVLMSVAPEEQDMVAIQALQDKMKVLTDRQGPLMEQQQQAQLDIVAEQQKIQLERQEQFKAMLAAHSQRKIDLKNQQASELAAYPDRIAAAKQTDMNSYLARKSAAEEAHLAAWAATQEAKRAEFEKLQMAELEVHRAARDASRAERSAKREERLRAKREAEEAAAQEQARKQAEAEAARVLAEEQARVRAEYERVQAEAEAAQRAVAQQQAEAAAAERAAQEAMLAQQQQALADQQAKLLAQQEEQARQQQAQLEQERLRLFEIEKEQAAALAAREAALEAREAALAAQQAALATPTAAKPTAAKPTAATATTGAPLVTTPPPPVITTPPPPAALAASVQTAPASFKMPAKAASGTLAKRAVAAPAASPAKEGDDDVVDVFAITKAMSQKPAAGPAKTALVSPSGKIPTAQPPAPMPSATPTNGTPTLTAAAPTASPKSAKLAAAVPPKVAPPKLPPTGPPPSVVASSAPPSGPPLAMPPMPAGPPPGSGRVPLGGPPLPSGPPPSLPSGPPPSLPSGPPPSLPSGPPPSLPPTAPMSVAITGPPPVITAAITGPPPSALGSAARPQPPAGARPQPPTITPNLAAFNDKPAGYANARPAPPMPTVAKGPPSQRIPTPSGAPSSGSQAQSGAYSGAGGPPPMPNVSKAPQAGPPPTPDTFFSAATSSAPPPASAGFYGPPPGTSAGSSTSAEAAPSSLSAKEMKSATSADTTKGVTRDKYGLPVSKTTTKGAHLLGATSKAKGPSRRPPSAMVQR
jgi:basic salivary proline-rich protein 1/2